jgi:hypothetical protein
MLENNIYNIDKEFDYPTIKDIVTQSLEKLVKQEASKKRPNDVIFGSKDNDYTNNVNNLLAPACSVTKVNNK